MSTWTDIDTDFVRRRYNVIAHRYGFYERLFCTPQKARKAAVDALALKAGDTVLEVGCGMGKNIPALSQAVGKSGRVIGIDNSEQMLLYAQECYQRGCWGNVDLYLCDALDFGSKSGALDAVFFSLSYNTMPKRTKVLALVWRLLKRGGRLVIFDGKPPCGVFGKLVLPLSDWLVRQTVLGNPHVRGWEDLFKLDPCMQMQEYLFGAYYVAVAHK